MMAIATRLDQQRWPGRLMLACAACVLTLGVLPGTAAADNGRGRPGYALRQAGPDTRHHSRSDHGYGKRHGSDDNHGRGRGEHNRGYDSYNYRYDDRGGRHGGGSYTYAQPAVQHYGYSRPPAHHYPAYRPHGYYPRYYAPPVHYVRRPLPYYSTVYVTGYPYPYYYDAGIFYRPYDSNFWISVSAPIGARVHGLPAGYLTFSYGGQTYYRAHSTYYVHDRPASQYVVVEPPPVTPPTYAGSTASTAAELFVYPARGQSDETTQRDRYECHLWSVSEVGVDPSYGDADERGRVDYRRALTACLEGRGYTVR